MLLQSFFRYLVLINMVAGDSFCSEKREISLLLCKLPIFGSWEEKSNDLGIEVFKTRNSARPCLLLVVFTFTTRGFEGNLGSIIRLN